MRRKPRWVIECACGCGRGLMNLDSEGREHSFLNGHNGRKYHGRDAEAWGRNKRWHKKHPETIRAGKKRYHRQRKVRAMLYLGGECSHCGLAYDGTNAAVFEFHHFDPKTKKYSVGNVVTRYSWATLLKELCKCILLCANCHNLHHGGKW